MRADNISVLNDTLKILKQGFYHVNGKKVNLKLNMDQMKKISVYLPNDIKKIEEDKEFKHIHILGRVGVGCENTDSFTQARKSTEFTGFLDKDHMPVLVLNLANPFNPGGGVRGGARAQEEDLCRKSSLLISLESDTADAYYTYNRSLYTNMGSDAIMITPQVEIIKEENGNLLEESVIVSVMTCAAPMLSFGMEGLSDEQYRKLLYNRITRMLKVAAHLNYQVLVLGAFGCGAFNNDARIVSDQFYKAIKSFDYDGMKAKDFFHRIDFAVLDRSEDQYNFNEFSRNFSDFYREENDKERTEIEEKIRYLEKDLDRIRGCLVGGAAGDALGYAIEFKNEEQIFEKFGPNGIQEYELTNGKALISDDTQMTLFTAIGILLAETNYQMKGIGSRPSYYTLLAYLDWLKTQELRYEAIGDKRHRNAWLLDVPELYERRAPGMTCLSALGVRKDKESGHSFMEDPINNSKGCGGIMRVAPLALVYRNSTIDVKEIDKESAEIAAITHSHSLGYMPAAVVGHIITGIFDGNGQKSLKDIIVEARDTVKELFSGDEHLDELIKIIDMAITLSENGQNDLDNIHQLGEGWIAEETLGIALYCSLKYQDDFTKAIRAAVNHGGDSDSTGAVTGNIVGALLGYEAIEEKWKKDLELLDVILEIAADICHGCMMKEHGHYQDPAWMSKYMARKRYKETGKSENI